MTEVRVELSELGRVLVASIEGEIDFSNTRDVGTQIREGVTNEHVGLAVDLSLIRYIDSAGVRMLFDLVSQLEACRQGIGLILPDSSPVRRLVRVTNLDSVATVFHSLEDCVKELDRNADDRI